MKAHVLHRVPFMSTCFGKMKIWNRNAMTYFKSMTGRANKRKNGRNRMQSVIILLISACFIQCTKETNEIKSNSYDHLSKNLIHFRGEGPEVDNGMLVFATHADIPSFIYDLRDAEDTQLERNVLYGAIGITDEIKAQGLNYTDNPACVALESEFGFHSLRESEENDLFSSLDRGDSTRVAIIADPYWKTLLNMDKSIQIGNRIFKFYDSGLIAIVGNADIGVYNDLNNTDELDILEGHNLRLGSATKENIGDFYDVDEYGNIEYLKPLVDVQITHELNSDESISLVNNSFIEYEDGTHVIYKWIYSDASYFIGINPDRIFATHDSVDLVFGNPSNDYDTLRIYPRACIISDFTITRLSGTTFRFSVSFGSSQYIIKWLFGDGASATGEVVEHTYAPGIPLSTIVTCQAIRNSGGPGQGTVACEASKTLNLDEKCNERGNNEDMQQFNIGSERWRIDCKIWIDGGIGGWFTTGDVGSRTKSMKKVLIGWAGRDAQQVWISLEGRYFRRTGSSCVLHLVPFIEETELNSGNVQRNINDNNDPRTDPDQLWSTHKMKIQGQMCVYSNNNGKLILD